MSRTYNVYVIETDISDVPRFKGIELTKPPVYVGYTSSTIEERFNQHKDPTHKLRMKEKNGIPIKILDKFEVKSIKSEKLANDIERLIWYKLRTSGDYIMVQNKYAPSMQGRTDYIDDYPNYEKQLEEGQSS